MTATGTITGATLEGAVIKTKEGEIGKWYIDSNGIYHTDASNNTHAQVYTDGIMFTSGQAGTTTYKSMLLNSYHLSFLNNSNGVITSINSDEGVVIEEVLVSLEVMVGCKHS